MMNVVEHKNKGFRLPARRSYLEAQLILADLFWKGSVNCEADPVQAVFWFDKASAHGDMESSFKLAECLLNGFATQKDVKRALNLFTF